MSRRNTKKNKEKFIEKYTELDCNISRTCIAVGIVRNTYRNWIIKDEEFAQAIEDAEESVLDDLESVIIKKAKGFRVETKKTTTKKIMAKEGEGEEMKIKAEENTVTTTVRYFPPDMHAAKLYMEARARHRGYAMKSDESNADQYNDDE